MSAAWLLPATAAGGWGSWLLPLIPIAPILLLAAIVVWFGRKAKAAGQTAAGQPGPISARPQPIKVSPKLAGGCLTVFFAPFLAFGVVGLYMLLLRPALQMLAARHWERVPCTIDSSRVTETQGDEGTMYGFEVTYRYVVRGEEYTSKRCRFVDAAHTGSRAGCEALRRRYSPGWETECLVDPRHPTEAVLDAGFSPQLLFGLIPLLFVLVGAGGMGFGLLFIVGRQRLPGPPSGCRPLPAGASASAAPRAGAVAGAAAGEQVLRAGTSRLGRLLLALFLALFWNGIVSVFIWQILESWRERRFEWAQAMFMTPFVLVGLALIAFFIYQLLALANPRPRLTVSSTTVPLGGRLEVRWEFSGQAERISHLRIWLEGREEVTYQRGTTTSTDKAVFARLELADRTERGVQRAGSGTVTVPADSMHSFRARHNKIVWALRVHGEIARWPDVQDEFPITVAAAPAGTPRTP